MATWPELQRNLRDNYKLVQDQPTWAALVWTFPGEVPIRQLVSAAEERAGECSWLVIGANAGAVPSMAPEDALARNAEMALGAVAKMGANYVVRFACPMEVATWELVQLALPLLAAEAVRLRGDVEDPSVLELFRCYAD